MDVIPWRCGNYPSFPRNECYSAGWIHCFVNVFTHRQRLWHWNYRTFYKHKGDSEVQINGTCLYGVTLHYLEYYKLSGFKFFNIFSPYSSATRKLDSYHHYLTSVNFLCPWFSVGTTSNVGIPKCSVVRVIKPSNGNLKWLSWYLRK